MAVVVYAPALALSQGKFIESKSAFSYSNNGLKSILRSYWNWCLHIRHGDFCCLHFLHCSRKELLNITNYSSLKIWCLFQGGMKAVMWTDTVQVLIMYGSLAGVTIWNSYSYEKKSVFDCINHSGILWIQVIFKGHADAGGFAAVWAANEETGRIEFDE